jgi:HAD superfamily hydrolase (TIGR01458 family)
MPHPSASLPKALLIDLAGVLHAGDAAIPGAIEALSQVRATGLPLRFLTNTTRTPRAVLVQKLGAMGFQLTEDEVLTAVHATRTHLARLGLHPHLLIHPDIANEMGESASEPDCVVLGDAAEDFSFAAMNQAFRLLMEGKPLIAMARNRYFQNADGLMIDMGAYVSALEYAAGVKAEIIGKPAPAFFEAALADLGVAASDALMIGDDLRDDIGGAQACGIPAWLVRTGKFRAQDEADPLIRPARVVDDFAAAAALLLAQLSR